MIEGSYRIERLAGGLAADRDFARARRKSLGTQAQIATVLSILSFVGAILTGGLGVIVFFPFLIWLLIVWSKSASLDRKVAKLEFAAELVHALQAEVAPGRKVKVHFNPESYDRAGTRYWSGRSQHGNTKHRYADLWFDLAFTLPEGTGVRLQRHADVKTKKGSIQGEKRRLRVQVLPNRRAWKGFRGWDGLRPLLQLNISEGFHNAPEDLQVRPKAQEDGAIRIKVEQRDADIKPREAMLVLETVLLFLASNA